VWASADVAALPRPRQNSRNTLPEATFVTQPKMPRTPARNTGQPFLVAASRDFVVKVSCVRNTLKNPITKMQRIA